MRRVPGIVIGSIVQDVAGCRTCALLRAFRGCAGQRTSPYACADEHPEGQTSAAWSVPRSFVTLLADHGTSIVAFSASSLFLHNVHMSEQHRRAQAARVPQ